MFHYEKEKNFCGKFANKEIVLIANDIGPLRCFESIVNYFPQKSFFMYFQNESLKKYLTSSTIIYHRVNLALLIFRVCFRKKNVVFILQSSHASLIEKLIVKLCRKVYVVQDFKDDYKFGSSVNYVTAFDSIPNTNFLLTDIHILNLLRPKISDDKKNGSLSNSLLVIGAKNLLSSNDSLDFINLLVRLCKNLGYKMHYKPHPMEDVSEYGGEFFSLNEIKLTYELPIDGSWPRLIVSPHSSLGYDIPEIIETPKGVCFKVLHTFGAKYDKKIFAYPGFKQMVSKKAINFNLDEIGEFFNEKN